MQYGSLRWDAVRDAPMKPIANRHFHDRVKSVCRWLGNTWEASMGEGLNGFLKPALDGHVRLIPKRSDIINPRLALWRVRRSRRCIAAGLEGGAEIPPLRGFMLCIGNRPICVASVTGNPTGARVGHMGIGHAAERTRQECFGCRRTVTARHGRYSQHDLRSQIFRAFASSLHGVKPHIHVLVQ
jgi:hypothetical protein